MKPIILNDTNRIEYVVAKHFNWRQNVIVPNISWGMGLRYEADVVILRPSGYASEIEIKTSKSDLKADLKKWHKHESNLFRQLYFAIPERLKDCVDIIPEKAGILLIEDKWMLAKLIRRAIINKAAIQWSLSQRQKLLNLAAMRIWDLKITRYNLETQLKRDWKHDKDSKL
jgi:hypothetical protein